MSLKDFEIIGKIGEGAYSTVFKVKRKSDQEIYALKKVIMHKLKSKEKNNALNEIRILASITHPNIISYKQAFFDDDSSCLCIVMEYADGGDLYQRISDFKKKSSLMSENFLWHILIKLARALKALHDLNIIHRDIKSANVFLTKEGKVKLGDMNVSKVAKEGMNHTQTGTPYYASPEVWKDDPYDVKSDIWSLGCVLYEAAALKPPFQAEDMKNLYKKVVKGKFVPLQNYSQDFNDVITVLLTQDPKKRPSSGEILKLPLVLKRVNIREEYEQPNSNLLNTIRMDSNAFNIRDILPEAKYSRPEIEMGNKIELPQLAKFQRGVTYKRIDDNKKSLDVRLGYYRNLSENIRRDNKSSIKAILRENYGALKLPKMKYPQNVSQARDFSPINDRKREIFNIPLLPVSPAYH
ncbi:hypothetical protein SteCoe_30101 [Stentor coeruleus]|uniref:non-specific serine/threonine protein kinase n=1 Tax=Stentor coeruleus TaxID=5963 RepID=A0A1R2B4N4_9CILI|nr:hypothetical protein SteCoe_30101 [Stentor coeruleus]